MYKKNYFNFKKIKNKYFLTNDFGSFIFLSSSNFKRLLSGDVLSQKVYEELINKQFIYEEKDELFLKMHFEKLKEYKGYLEEQTSLHIFVISKNCNYNCVYCQAGFLNTNDNFLMNEETAKKAVDIAFESPNINMTFEFQGGEPLINFPIIKYIVEYSKKKNSEILDQRKKKKIDYSIVSNLSLLTDEEIDFIAKNNIAICTSIDGDRKLQNINRPYAKHDSYDATIQNLKKLQEKDAFVSALLTTTKYSLNNAKSIAYEYVNLGLKSITVRPLTKLGKAANNWNEIGYTPEEFVKFYKEVLKYIIKKNKQGVFLREGIAAVLLSKILNFDGGNYMELRSPCGASIGQLAYYYDGEIYTCDEGRMLAEMGDKRFLLGNVNDSNFKELINHDTTKKMCEASCLECNMTCHSCVYMPYCGTCPVLNYASTGYLELKSRNDYKCRIMSGILDILFHYIENDKSVLEIFKGWL